MNVTISQWHEVEANDVLPEELRRDVRRPELSLDACESLHQMLMEELARLEGQK